MSNILLVPANDLVSHPIGNRFMFIAKKMKEKFDVNFFVLRYKNIPTASKTERKLDFKLLEFKDVNPGNVGFYYVANIIPIFSRILKQLRDERIDVIIHANILPSALAVSLGRMFRTPLIFDYQDHFPESATIYFRNELLKSFAYAVTSQITKFNIKHSDVVVTVTDSHKKRVKEIDRAKSVDVIPNGVDVDLFRPIPRSVSLEALNMEEFEEKIILTYFGSIDPWLDFSTVFNVVKRLVKRGFDIALLIIGFCHHHHTNTQYRIWNGLLSMTLTEVGQP